MERTLILTFDDQGHPDIDQLTFELWRACHNCQFKMNTAQLLEPYETVRVTPNQVTATIEAP